MTRPPDDRILAFLTGDADADVREEVLRWIEHSPDNAREVRSAATGLDAMRGLGASIEDRPSTAAAGSQAMTSAGGQVGVPSARGRRRVPVWWLPLVAAASAAVAVPAALLLTGSPSAAHAGQPVAPEPSFVVTLHGTWPDAGEVGAETTEERAADYWAWTTDLAARGVLVAAGDLRWEPGVRLTTAGPAEPLALESDPGFLVGMFTIRAADYDEARRIAAECPHLRYGGTVSVRRVGGGFVTVAGNDDWSS